jgi:thymidylate synthase (FAD)
MGGAQRFEIKVHDHGFVALIDAMPRLVPKGQTADAAIVQAARVSYGVGTKKVSEDRALIRYLLRHRHTTPFEMVEFKFHVAMPIFIARQWIRHRTANVNEYSGRYSILPDRFYRPTLDNVRKQSRGNRQGGAERFAVTPSSPAPPAPPAPPAGATPTDDSGLLLQPAPTTITPPNEAATAAEFLRFLDDSEALYNRYLRLTEQGVSREMARIGLPVSLYTEWYWKCDLHNTLRFLSLRLDEHAQEEIRLYAKAMRDLIAPIVPVTLEAFQDYELDALHLTRLEVEALRRGDAAIDSTNQREQAEWQAKRRRLGLAPNDGPAA